MPLYEYRCTSCGYQFEKIQKFSDAPERVCPHCQGELVRPMTAPALKFEGAGWYINDYAPKAASSTSGSESKGGESKTGEAKAGEPKSGESKTESKASDSGSSASAPASGSASTTSSSSGSTSTGSGGSN